MIGSIGVLEPSWASRLDIWGMSKSIVRTPNSHSQLYSKYLIFSSRILVHWEWCMHHKPWNLNTPRRLACSPPLCWSLAFSLESHHPLCTQRSFRRTSGSICVRMLWTACPRCQSLKVTVKSIRKHNENYICFFLFGNLNYFVSHDAKPCPKLNDDLYGLFHDYFIKFIITFIFVYVFYL